MDYLYTKSTKSEPCDDQNEDNSNDKDADSCLIRLRGLPWSVNADDVISFLSNCQIKGGKNGVHLTLSSLGRPSGEAYVELASPEDAAEAVKKDRENIGHRYIEVFRTTRSEMDWVLSHSAMNVDSLLDEGCIRIRGLPYGCTEEEVASFFSGLQIVPNGINFAMDQNGRATGEAYVQFVNKENLEKALQKHMEKIGHRYIEIFRSSLTEVRAMTGPKMRPPAAGFGRMAPYNRSERLGGPNRFRGVDGSARFPRMPRYENVDYWEDSVESDSWGSFVDGSAPRIKPLMGAGLKGAGDSQYGPLHRVHMRGLPYRATETDIAMFFSPLQPKSVRIIYDQSNRPSGEATAIFASHDDAVEAMSKDKEHLQNRYIDLLLDSEPDRDNFGGQTTESSLVFSPSFRPRPRGPPFRGGRAGNRARAAGSAFGSNSRAGRGTKPFMSGSGAGFRSTF